MFKKYFSTRKKFSLAPADDFCRPFVTASLLLVFIICLSGCQSIPTLSSVNLAEAGWTTHQGQAVWRPKKDSVEIAGEMLVATNPDGRSFVQFTKTPLPFVAAQTTSNSWQINFIPQNKIYSAHGKPPKSLIWFQLVPNLNGVAPIKHWSWKKLENDSFRLQNESTGESLEGYLTP